ncbi:MAG: lamin tail domain-containing protein [Myxococcota bacterium]
MRLVALLTRSITFRSTMTAFAAVAWLAVAGCGSDATDAKDTSVDSSGDVDPGDAVADVDDAQTDAVDPDSVATDVDAPDTLEDIDSGFGPDLQPDADADAETDAATDAEADADVALPGCTTSTECDAATPFCDLGTGSCVECLHAAHCGWPGGRCVDGACQDAVECAEDATCTSLGDICDDLGFCAECAASADCGQGETCTAGQCYPEAKACSIHEDCSGVQNQCVSGTCAQCAQDSECASAEYCWGGLCLPDICLPGDAACSDDQTLLICNEAGSGIDVNACGEGNVCADDQCQAQVCEPAAVKCADAKLATCNGLGLAWDEAACPDQSTCVAGACAALVCEPDQKVCKDNAVETCDATGTAPTLDACKDSQICKVGACVDKICTPGATKCDGNNLLTCSDDATAWNTAACGDGKVCAVDKCFAAVLPGSLVVTELMPNPKKVLDADGEYIEIFNATQSNIDLAGLTLKSGAGVHQIPTAKSIPVASGAYVVLSRSATETANGGFLPAYAYGTALTLPNTVSCTVAIEQVGNVIDSVHYDPGKEGWAAMPDGASYQLDPAKANAQDNDAAANWCMATKVFGAGDFGSPGAANPACPVDSDGDGLFDDSDNCKDISNADQKDTDKDGVGDVCDNCPAAANSDQKDGDGDGLGDVCDPQNCLPGAIKCSGEKLATCEANGLSWAEQACPVKMTCVGDACTAVICEANLAVCNGNSVDACDATGTKLTNTACKDTQVCKAGACADKICTPGAKKCEVNTLKTCAGDGTVWNDAPCGDGKICSVDKCFAVVAPGSLVITELMPNPKAVLDSAGEWLEVHNDTNSAIEFGGLTLRSGTATHVVSTASPLTVNAGAYVVLAISASETTNGGLVPFYAYGAALNLPNSSSTTVAIEQAGVVIDSVHFVPAGGDGWLAAGNGASYQLNSAKTNAQDNDAGANWCLSTKAFGAGDLGSPGAANAECIADADSDGVADGIDNCKLKSNPDQADADNDGFGDVCDNCKLKTNVDQADVDNDGVGDVCDNCKSISNADQADTDQDTVGNVCDNCPVNANTDQKDTNGNGKGDVCEGAPATECGNNVVEAGEECDDGGKVDGDGCSAACKFELASSVKAGDLVITEIMYNPSAVLDDKGEWFEVKNVSKFMIDVDKMVVVGKSATTDTFTVAGSNIIKPGQYFVFGINSDPTLNGGATIQYVYSAAKFPLGNTTSDIVELQIGGVSIDKVEYLTSAPWPTSVNGFSLSLSNNTTTATLNDSGSNWCGATTAMTGGDKGTPGSANPTCAGVLPPGPPPQAKSTPKASLPAPPYVDLFTNALRLIWCLDFFGR